MDDACEGGPVVAIGTGTTSSPAMDDACEGGPVVAIGTGTNSSPPIEDACEGGPVVAIGTGTTISSRTPHIGGDDAVEGGPVPIGGGGSANTREACGSRRVTGRRIGNGSVGAAPALGLGLTGGGAFTGLPPGMWVVVARGLGAGTGTASCVATSMYVDRGRGLGCGRGDSFGSSFCGDDVGL